MKDRFSGPAPKSVKVIALVLGVICLIGMSGLGLFFSLDAEIEDRLQAGEQSSRGTIFTAYPDLMWRLLMQRKFPRDYGPGARLTRGEGSLCEAFIEKSLPRASSPLLGWIARPFSEHLMTTYIDKKRLMLYFANDWEGPPRGLDHQSIKRFRKPPSRLQAREIIELVLVATGTTETLLNQESDRIYRRLLTACVGMGETSRRPQYCEQMVDAADPKSVPSESEPPSTDPE
tara:strand:+ start:1102 stop:1794 length:693 start_codon:yes stop_codon:yes gene_type:complete